jgi:uncharacterized repeat protein (TIGR01451 family)
MSNYNPNSVWTGQKKDPAYIPEAFKKAAPAGTEKPVPEKPKPFFKKTPVEQFDEPEAPKRKILLWASIAGGCVVLGIVFYLVFLRTPVGPNVSIEFSKPDQILTGDQFHFGLILTNYSSNILKNAALSVSLPDNVSFVGQPPDQRVMEQVLGDLGPGSINKPDLILIVTGNPNSIKHIDTKLAYGTDATSKTQFETDGGVDLVIGGPAISLNFNAPVNIFSGQDFDLPITYNNNTSHSFSDVVLNMQYPPVYTFTRSTMPPGNAGNNSWNLGTIPAGGSGNLTITGNIVGPNNALYALEGTLAGNVQGSTYTLTDQTANVAVGSSPLTIAITVDNAPDFVAHTGDILTYTFNYTNTSNVTFQNAVLKATLVGAMFDFSTLQSNGSFSSITNTVTWYAANTPAFLNLAPGQSGSVSLTVNTKSSFPIRLLSDKNYTLKATAQISSPTVPPGTVGSSTVSAAAIETKIGGAVALAAKGYWRDAPSGILNSGPYPPKVNNATQYTVHWIITDYSTDLQNVSLSASLQSGTTCTGQIKSNMSTAPVCNSGSGLITWQIPSIPATTGITGHPAEAIFQVVNTPAVNQVGQSIPLVGPVALQATDVFTGAALQASAVAVTTDIPDDKTISSNQNRRVAP